MTNTGCGLALLVVYVLCAVDVNAMDNTTHACHELGGMSLCASRNDCYFEGDTGPCKVDNWNCTCPGSLYPRTGWFCSCRVVGAFNKLSAAARADKCEALLIAGASHLTKCADDDDGIRCRDRSDAFEGTWMVQAKAMRGNWANGEWWSLPFTMGTYESHLSALQPLEYVKVCVFDRMYTLGPDVLAHLRLRNTLTQARPVEHPVLYTQASAGIAHVSRVYEYRIFIPAADRRRRLLSHELGDEVIGEVFEATNIPGKVGTSYPNAVLDELKSLRKTVTKGLDACSVHATERACNGETQFPCHWNWKEGHSYSCWVDTMNCVCPDTVLTYTGVGAPVYTCSCRNTLEDTALGFLFIDAKKP